MQIYIPVTPMGCVRMTRKGKFVKPEAQRYLAYKSQIGYHLRQHYELPLEGPIKVSATFYMPIPASDTKKKAAKKLGKLVTVKPDIDNLLKGLFDAANGIVWPDDKVVSEIGSVRKVYSEKTGITLEVEVIDEQTG